jgi:hypothetical protein
MGHIYRPKKHDKARGKPVPDYIRRNIFTALQFKHKKREPITNVPVRKHKIVDIASANGVTPRFVYRLQKQIKEAGFRKDCWRKDFHKPKHRKLKTEDLELLDKLATEFPDKSSVDIQNLFKGQSNTKVSRFTIWRYLQKHTVHLINPVNRLRKIRGVNKRLATLLIRHGYENIEKIKNSSPEEIFSQIYPNASRNRLNELDYIFRILKEEPKNKSQR